VTLRLHPPQGNPIDVEADKTLIGRDRAADIRLTESSVSRKHATIEKRGAQWVIVDSGSANGTFVNDVQVGEKPLEDGQTLRLGTVSFRVEIEVPPTPTQTIRPTARLDDDPKTRPGVPAYRTPAAPPPPVTAPPAAAPSVPATAATMGATAPMPAVSAAMSPAQAAELLGIPVGTPAAEVRRQYQRLHNDLHVRMTNTPSPSLRRMYQKNLQELKAACEVMAPGGENP